MKCPTTWPVVVKKGNSTVKVYRTLNKGYTEFKVVFYDPEGKRKSRAFADYADARKEADSINDSVNDGNLNTLTLDSSEKQEYTRALNILGPAKVSLTTAASAYADAIRNLGSVSLSDAVQFYLKRHPQTVKDKGVRAICDEFLAMKKASGVSNVYSKNMRWYLDQFASRFHCALGSVGHGDLNEWIGSLDCSPRTKQNQRGAVRTLVRWAERRDYLPKDHIDWERVDKSKAAQTQIHIFTSDEISKLLEAAIEDEQSVKLTPFPQTRFSQTGLIPFLVLGAFAGLRNAEIKRQLWSDIHIDRVFLRVTGAKGNTPAKRLVTIESNLAEWLGRYKRGESVCCDYRNVESAILRIAQKAGVKWKRNALRHSFISYKVALSQNVGQVALEAGNSPTMIFKHYRELVTIDEAKTWFAISPEPDSNVISMTSTKQCQTDLG